MHIIVLSSNPLSVIRSAWESERAEEALLIAMLLDHYKLCQER